MPSLQELLNFLSAVALPLTVAVIVSLFNKYVLNRETPLPFAKKPKGAYKHLHGDWWQYHVTRNNHHSLNPFWVRDLWRLQVYKGIYVRGELLFPLQHEFIGYKMLGEIRQGRLIITGRSERNPEDFFTVIFPDLTIQDEDDALVGTMIAFDFQNSLYVGPMILSKKGNLGVKKLNGIIATLTFPEQHSYNFLTTEAETRQLDRNVFKPKPPEEKSMKLWVSKTIGYLRSKISKERVESFFRKK